MTEKPLLLLDYTWLESNDGRKFVVLGRWFGKDSEEIELLEYMQTKPFRRPAAMIKLLLEQKKMKQIT